MEMSLHVESSYNFIQCLSKKPSKDRQHLNIKHYNFTGENLPDGFVIR